MKKLTTIMIVAILLVTFSIPVCAQQITSPGSSSGTTLSYSVAQTFTVNIPATIPINSGNTGTGEISITNSVIPFGKSLNVKISEAANYDSGFYLKDTATGNEANKISYAITKTGGSSVAKGTSFLTVAAGTATGSTTLTFTAGAVSKSGTYSDTLTFAVAVE